MNHPVTTIRRHFPGLLIVNWLALVSAQAGSVEGTVYIDEAAKETAKAGKVQVCLQNDQREKPREKPINPDGSYGPLVFPDWKNVVVVAIGDPAKTIAIPCLLTMDDKPKKQRLLLLPRNNTLSITWLRIGAETGGKQPQAVAEVAKHLYEQNAPAADVYAFIAGVRRVRPEAFPELPRGATTNPLPTAWAIYNTERAIQKNRPLLTREEFATQFNVDFSEKEYANVIGFAAGFSPKISTAQMTSFIEKQIDPNVVKAAQVTAREAEAAISVPATPRGGSRQ